MSLRLTNTLTGRTEEFKPLTPNQVSIYCCGVTVYDLCHLGHARSYIVWDVLRRYLIWKGYKVIFIQNFTDIDDKILTRAAKESLTMNEISEKNIEEFHKDMDALGILRPDRMPRATQCLDSIRSMIEKLEAKGAAYSIDGDVYFSVLKHDSYGKLSGRDITEQQLNADGRMTEKEKTRKKNSFDFALWKKAKKGEPSFPSPWGNGRPGWHIECSAMVLQELGETIDIHLGGADLIFPHHENEIAQSELANGKKLSTYWLHNGMVNVKGQKMSKSLGNFTTIRALLEEKVSAMTLRFFVLQANYRKPLDFTNQALSAAALGWKGLNAALCLGIIHQEKLGWPNIQNTSSKLNQVLNDSSQEIWVELRQRFIDSLDDDLNTSSALAVIFELARPLKTLSNQIEREDLNLGPTMNKKDLHLRWLMLVELAGVLGLRGENLHKSQTSKNKGFPEDKEIEAAIKERQVAKSKGDFKKADQIRDFLRKRGIELIDKPGGVTDWIRI